MLLRIILKKFFDKFAQSILELTFVNLADI